MKPIIANVNVDNITQRDMLLQRFDADTEKHTEVTVVSNKRDIPESAGGVRYLTLPLDEFVGTYCEGWDGHSPITLYFNENGQLDHWEKSGAATAASATA